MLFRWFVGVGLMIASLVAMPAQTQTTSILDRAFDATHFREVELRQIQRALLFAGFYNGLLDGEWGDISAKAIDAYADSKGASTALNRHLPELLDLGDSAMARLKWQEVYFPPFGAMIGFPSAVLEQTAAQDDLIAYANEKDTLGIMLGRLASDRTLALHENALTSAIGDRDPYTVRREDRMVTLVRNDGSGSAYVRSDRDDQGWVSVFIYADGPDFITEAGLMASAYHFGPDMNWDRQRSPNLAAIRALMGTGGPVLAVAPDDLPGIDLPPAGDGAGGYEDIFKNDGGSYSGGVAELPDPGGSGVSERPGGTGEPRRGSEPAPGNRDGGGPGVVVGRRGTVPDTDPRRPPRMNPDRADSTGTGFYISTFQLVTNHHVIDGCRIVTLEDGTPVRVLGSDRRVDLALLEASTPSAAWLTLADVEGARLGQKIFVLGYPYYGVVNKSLSLTTGVVSSLTGVDDDLNNFTLSAPIQPGNSGGPVLNADGYVLGVAVARISEEYISDRTGSFPQNINFAIQRAALGNFLSSYGGSPSSVRRPAVNMELGAPGHVQSAVTPVLCFN